MNETTLRSIDATVVKVAGILIKVRCLLPSDGMLINERAYKNNIGDITKYMSINYHPVVDIVLPSDNSAYFGRERRLSLTEYGKTQFVLLLQKYLRMWNTTKMFYRNEENGLCVYNEMKEDGTYRWKIEAYINEDVVGIIPAILVDPVDPQFEFEAARLMLNKSDNFVELTYSEMYTMMHALETLNVSMMGISTMLLYIEWIRSHGAVFAKTDSKVKPLDEIEDGVERRIRGRHSLAEIDAYRKELVEEDGGTENNESQQRDADNRD